MFSQDEGNFILSGVNKSNSVESCFALSVIRSFSLVRHTLDDTILIKQQPNAILTDEVFVEFPVGKKFPLLKTHVPHTVQKRVNKMTSQRSPEQELITHDLQALSVSKRLVRSVSQKLKTKTPKTESPEESNEYEHETTGVSLRCLTLYARGGGCRVSADMSEDSAHHHHHPTSGRRRSSASEDRKKPTKDGTNIDCFSHAVREKLFRRGSHKRLVLPGGGPTNMNSRLPDDILEMCLVRLPISSLMTARLVCRKWRALTSSARFMQARREGPHRTPWLFLFGFVRDGYCSGEIHALDVSLDRWHRIDSHALKGRFLFSVATLNDEVYVVGGCSSLANFGRVDRSSFKTHKGILVFTPSTKSWRKAAAMRHARSSPVLGISEVGADYCSVRPERRFHRARSGASDVYEDPHRLSVRRQSSESCCAVSGLKSGFVMIAVGGLGPWDEPLDSCEIYDPVLNRWTEIQRLPLDFGVACAGAACRGVFYVYSESDVLAGYDVEKGYWVRVQVGQGPAPARVREYYPKMVGCGGRVFMVSVSWCEGEGEIGRRNKAVRKVWEVDFGGGGWREVGAHPDAPMDWNAAFVGDDGKIFGVEMFKIFGQVLDFVTVFETGKGWGHISRNRVANGLDASSCMTKSMAVIFGQVLDFVTVFETGKGWGHISRNRVANGLDALSCMTKSMAVLSYPNGFSIFIPSPASARRSMGALRVSSVLFDLKSHHASTTLQVHNGDRDMKSPHFTLSKWASSDDPEKHSEEAKFEEDELLQNKYNESPREQNHDTPQSPSMPLGFGRLRGSTQAVGSAPVERELLRSLGLEIGFVMIAVGGLGPWDEPLDSCKIYDPVLNRWTEIQGLPLDFGVACAGAACREVFYVYSESDMLAGYDVEKGYWVRVQVSPGPAPARVREYYPKIVGCGGRVFMVSVSWCEGEGEIGRQNKAVMKVWEVDFEGGGGWREMGAHPDAPMDWNAAFVGDDGGGGSIFGVEMFKIFGQVLDFVTVFETGKGWGHISRNRVANGLDASSCIKKSM
ncbi:F-box/kelch-repeat protein, partial [Striga asiatica]